ncbi:glycosyltransferase family 9 protein [Wenzhouxiangella sp. AB-CW3]|uniref:glycosyltransferase family 9 protein n=1 Tax=Wenzhouxiangella sp. AB-CW3 TaxID=2771012 RepID=UPI00168B14B5|nr:glycosyltransferase family 9 protein [Wenzhouxiangella sp. AB-CW3]QOC21730.1 glycosyltransferase family 9 protein [Wenzhouxiangella sp. AB-CW3]
MSIIPPSPRSICLLRLSALGDVCNTVPLLRVLQNAWPDTAVTWIVGQTEHRLVANLPAVEFIVFDKRRGRAAIRDLRRRLGKRQFDILLHAQVSMRSNLLAARVKARRRIGFDRFRSREGHGLVINERIPARPFQHQAQAFLEFARHLGLPTHGVERRLPLTDQARAFAQRHQPRVGHAVLISPASSHPQRNWTTSGYAEIADWVIEQTDRPVILVGGPGKSEISLGLAIEQAMRNRPLNLIGKDTLEQAVAMYDRAACLVTPDSGPAHLAAAMGTPVVGLYAATWSRRSGPWGSLEHCVDRFPEATRHFLDKPPEKVRWGYRLERPGVMELITPGDVIEKLRELL